jgi:hypothetical protein
LPGNFFGCNLENVLYVAVLILIYGSFSHVSLLYFPSLLHFSAIVNEPQGNPSIVPPERDIQSLFFPLYKKDIRIIQAKELCDFSCIRLICGCVDSDSVSRSLSTFAMERLHSHDNSTKTVED